MTDKQIISNTLRWCNKIRKVPTTRSVALFTDKFDRLEFPDLIEDGLG